MNALVNVLTEKTESLRLDFIERTKAFCQKDFAKVKSDLEHDEEFWFKKFDLKYEMITPLHGGKPFAQTYGNKMSSVTKMKDAKRHAEDLMKLGIEEYCRQSVADAEAHYHTSVKKLAGRLEKLGIIANDTLEISSGMVGQNINLTITQGERSLKAWTIYASGEIQRPHYRYLVK